MNIPLSSTALRPRFTGRMTLSEYHMHQSLFVIPYLLAWTVPIAVAVRFGVEWGVALWAVSLVPIQTWSLSMDVRRLHDVGISGKWAVLRDGLGAVGLALLVSALGLWSAPQSGDVELFSVRWLVSCSAAAVMLLAYGVLKLRLDIKARLPGDHGINTFGPPGPFVNR